MSETTKQEHIAEAKRCEELAQRFAEVPQLRIAYQAAADYHAAKAKELEQ